MRHLVPAALILGLTACFIDRTTYVASQSFAPRAPEYPIEVLSGEPTQPYILLAAVQVSAPRAALIENAKTRARQLGGDAIINFRISGSISVARGFVVRWSDSDQTDDIRHVINREYFGCSTDEVAYLCNYRHYYGFDDCSLWFLTYCSRVLVIPIGVAVTRFQSCGCQMETFVQQSGLTAAAFVPPVHGEVDIPAPYARVYSAQIAGHVQGPLSNQEYRALIDLRIATEYYGQTPHQFFSQVHSSEPPCHVLFAQYQNCGKGGKNWRGETCRATVRPWELPESEREASRRLERAESLDAHRRFRQEHSAQIEEFETRRWSESFDRFPGSAHESGHGLHWTLGSGDSGPFGEGHSGTSSHGEGHSSGSSSHGEGHSSGSSSHGGGHGSNR